MHSRLQGNTPGSGPLGALAQIAWFGQPAHESALPANSCSGPTQSAHDSTQSVDRAFTRPLTHAHSHPRACHLPWLSRRHQTAPTLAMSPATVPNDETEAENGYTRSRIPNCLSRCRGPCSQRVLSTDSDADREQKMTKHVSENRMRGADCVQVCLLWRSACSAALLAQASAQYTARCASSALSQRSTAS